MKSGSLEVTTRIELYFGYQDFSKGIGLVVNSVQRNVIINATRFCALLLPNIITQVKP